MRSSLLAAVAFAVSAGALAWLAEMSLFGCGASYQAIYEGEVRFEHCYKLDEEPNIPLTQRRECWKEWTQFYTYEQTRDRVEYAATRLHALSRQIDGPTAEPAGSEADAGGNPHAIVGAPAPTSAFETPPVTQIVKRDDGGTAMSADAGPVGAHTPSAGDLAGAIDVLDPSNSPPGQMCIITCGKGWHTCWNGCTKDQAKCKTGCDTRFKACVPKCVWER